MNIFEKVKLAVQLNKIYKEIMKMDKLKGFLGKLDGVKSLLGLFGIVGYYGAKAYNVEVPEIVLTTSYGLLGIGLAHKLNKGTDILKKVLPILSSIIALLDKKKEEKK